MIPGLQDNRMVLSMLLHQMRTLLPLIPSPDEFEISMMQDKQIVSDKPASDG